MLMVMRPTNIDKTNLLQPDSRHLGLICLQRLIMDRVIWIIGKQEFFKNLFMERKLSLATQDDLLVCVSLFLCTTAPSVACPHYREIYGHKFLATGPAPNA